MRYRCGLCMVSPSADGFEGDRETVRQHIEDHNVLDVELYLTQVSGEQMTLTTATKEETDE